LRVFFGLTALVDDGIVVDEVKKGVTSMFPVRVLRERLGADGMAELHTVVNDAGRQWKEDVLAITAERFERRLAEEIGALRVDMAKEFAVTRADLAETRVSLFKWSFVFWIGQVAAVTGMMAFLLRTLGPR